MTSAVERDNRSGAAGKCYALPGVPRTVRTGTGFGVAGKRRAFPDDEEGVAFARYSGVR